MRWVFSPSVRPSTKNMLARRPPIMSFLSSKSKLSPIGSSFLNIFIYKSNADASILLPFFKILEFCSKNLRFCSFLEQNPPFWEKLLLFMWIRRKNASPFHTFYSFYLYFFQKCSKIVKIRSKMEQKRPLREHTRKSERPGMGTRRKPSPFIFLTLYFPNLLIFHTFTVKIKC